MSSASTRMTYAGAGVNIDAGECFAQMIKDRVATVWPTIGGEIGGFAGTVSIPPTAMKLAASVDGTGTKAILAAMMDMYDGIGQDAVAMSAVDTYMDGKLPAYLLDILNVAILDPDKHIAIIDSVIRGCKLANCQLIGGETAELPDMFRHDWMFNLDTAVVGFDGDSIEFVPAMSGQDVYGWASHGLGSNGYSLARNVLRLTDKPSVVRRRLQRVWSELGCSLAEALLQPTTIWISEIEKLRRNGVQFAGHAHITGGGMPGNIPRILPADLKVVVDRNLWDRPPIFSLIQKEGNVEGSEMDRTFNQGVQVVSIVDAESSIAETGCVRKIGVVADRFDDEPQVQFVNQFLE